MEQTEQKNDEFITEQRKNKKIYEISTRQDGTRVVIYDPRNLKPADKEEIQMLVNSGCIPQRKRKDITKDDMIKYVKENYDEIEVKILENKLATINETNDKNKKITFITIKTWFRDRYIYYPKGKDYQFSNKEKQERYINAFNEHIKKLKNERNKKPQNPITDPKE